MQFLRFFYGGIYRLCILAPNSNIMKPAFKFSYLLIQTFALLLGCKQLNAQCNISIINLPDTILACKNTTVQLNPGVYTTTGVPYYVDTTWSPAAGLSNPNILNPIVNVGTTSSNYVLTVQAVTPTNLIPNGDFSQGNTIFSSSYIYGTGGTYGLLSLEGQFAIASNPNSTHVNFANFGDHTTGTGQMMVVNGAGVANVNIWCQTINVNPNTYYDFSAWGATCVASNPAVLQFSINGTLIGTALSLPITTGLWTQFHATWFSGSATSITICITDQATATSGNDFAIDDISFREICNVSDSVYIKAVNLTPTIQTIKQFGCDEDTIQFVANNGIGNIPYSYLWSFGDGYYSNSKDTSHIYTVQGIYNVKLITELSGCKDSTTVTINTLHPLDAKFSIADTFCVNEVVTAIDNSVISGPTVYDWQWGDGTNSVSNTHVYAASGSYTITLVITDTIGCADSVSHTIYVLDAPVVSFTSEDTICVGDPIFFHDSTNAFTQSIQWDFNDGKILSDIHNPLHNYDAAGTYNVVLTGINSQCAPSQATKTIKVFGYPAVNLGPDTMICPGITGSILLADLNNPSAVYVWSTGETTNAITVTQAGHYWVTSTTAGSKCSTTDSIWVKRDCYLTIPNSFSPNGDGRNDYFLPREILSSGVASFTMNIFNRWGENIFTTSSIDGRGWDGKYNSIDQPVGVYIYEINVAFINNIKKVFNGNVTLLR
jgi:gliding motility-associated-like protein